MSQSKSAFADWFVAQFGKRPMTRKEEVEVRAEAFGHYTRAKLLDEKIAKVDAWDAAERAALRAWNARGGK